MTFVENISKTPKTQLPCLISPVVITLRIMTRDNIHELELQAVMPDDSNVGPAILAHKIRVLIRTGHHLGNDGQNLMLSYLLSATD